MSESPSDTPLLSQFRVDEAENDFDQVSHTGSSMNPVRDLRTFDKAHGKLGRRYSASAGPSVASTDMHRPRTFSTSANPFGGTSRRSYGSVSVDMEAISSDHQFRHDDNDGDSNFLQAGNSDDDHSDMDFHSKPSSRRSSDTSSLDDVCFPLDQQDDDAVWPDIKVLEEFYIEETERLKNDVLRETDEANFHFAMNHNHEEDHLDSESNEMVGFSYPIVTKVDADNNSNRDSTRSQTLNSQQFATKLLGNHKINETETLNGRLRPPKINPFDRKSIKINNYEFLKNINYPPQIINKNPEHFRYTYFREDLNSTVHSPTISGLLQPGQSFNDLFNPDEYSKKQLPDIPQPSSSRTPSIKNPHSSSTSLKNMPIPELTPMEENITESESDEVSPFWLDILNPTEEEMKVLSKTFGIHPLTTEDIFLGEIREKVELFKDYYFVCFRSFDIVQEKIKRSGGKRNKQSSNLGSSLSDIVSKEPETNIFSRFFKNRRRQSSIKSTSSNKADNGSITSSFKRRQRDIELEKFQRKSGDRHKPRNNELEPLNAYILVFKNAVLTFHFAPTPHMVNVRRRARLLYEYVTVTPDWIAYALIDDVTDAFGPMIESIEDEVNDIEDAILNMNNRSDDDDSDDDDSDDDSDFHHRSVGRKKSIFDRRSLFDDDKRSVRSVSSRSSSSRSTASNVIEWKKKGDMMKRIGETRKRVMSLVRLLGSKVDVIKGFAKRCNEQSENGPVRSEIGMYLGDIQDHIVTMVQSLNHYEKLLARSHSNYLAQINIDMTRVNNDMNDVLGKISILGTVVLPMNIVTGLWGMNVIVPGQDYDGLRWFWCITAGMFAFAFFCYNYAKRMTGI
jgi:magnesium transporter